MNFLLSVLSGPGGKTSSMRVSTLLCVCCVMGTWTAVSLQKKELQPLSEWHVTIVLGALGLKAYQRTKESESPKTNGAS